MENQVMSPAEKSPEEIEREMERTRHSLSEKMAALEQQFTGSVQMAADTLNGTIEAVQSFVAVGPDALSDTVKQAAAAASESVRETFDVTHHVRRHPLAAIGTAVAAGFVTGRMMAPNRGPAVPPPSGGGTLAAASVPSAATVPSAAAPSQAAAPRSEPGFLDDIMKMFGDKLKEIAKTGLETASAGLLVGMKEGIPRLINEAGTRLIESQFAEPTDGPSRFNGPRENVPPGPDYRRTY